MRPETGGMYGGRNKDFKIDWIASGYDYGFVCCEITADEMNVKFLDVKCDVIKEITVRK
jgi:hypothetical protein